MKPGALCNQIQVEASLNDSNEQCLRSDSCRQALTHHDTEGGDVVEYIGTFIPGIYVPVAWLNYPTFHIS